MPYVNVHVCLSDFDNDDLAEHLEGAGWTCTEPGATPARPRLPDVEDFVEGITMTAERADLERVRAQFYQGNLQPAAELLINLFRDARGAAL